MDGITSPGTQQAFGLAVQKGALETQASMASTLLEGASAGLRQLPPAGTGLQAGALGDRGIGTRLDIVA